MITHEQKVSCLLKRDRLRRNIYCSRKPSKVDVFNYIELLYNTTRYHVINNG